MGQYYNSVLKDKNGVITMFYNYGLKLMEHSYFNNPYVCAVCEILTEEPHHVAWVGDYADDDSDMTHERLHNNNKAHQLDDETGFSPLRMVLVNHTKKKVLWLCDYYNKALYKAFEKGEKDVWVIHPLPLLTCKGNGRGGGDYRGINQKCVGIWAEDLLELIPATQFEYNYQTKEMVHKDLPDYKEVMFEFEE